MTASQGRAAGAARLVRRRAGTLAYLVRLQRLSPDWRTIARHKLRGTRPTRPLRLRDGTVLHHGVLDDPLLMLHEVWVEQLYRPPEPPRDGAVLLDLGANIGAVAIHHCAREPALHVHAFEPNPSACAALRRNVAANALADRVTVHEVAVAHAPGALELWVGGPSHEASAYTDGAPAGATHRVTVPALGLDQAWERAGAAPVWLLKIDTEGAEVDILEGAAAETLAAASHAIVETHDDIVPGAHATCRALLREAGFTIVAERRFPWDQALLHAARAAR